MTLSMKDLFSRQGIDGEIISLRNSLANHHEGLQMGFRAAHNRFLTPVTANGFRRGCRHPSDVTLSIPEVFTKNLGGVLPSWVAVHDHETRTIEGILSRSRAAVGDFPFKPWHTSYDWNFHVRVDKQYTYLLSERDIDQDRKQKNDFECEWETNFLPSWAWPQEGSRVWMVGRWIYDCGHPEGGHKTEIHPPKAVVSFRTEAVAFPGSAGPTRANHAVVYIGRRGGYWDQPINDQDYAFDLYLPPKPHAEATPLCRVLELTGSLPVEPQITPFPHERPRALRVVIPLQGVRPEPEQYGVGIAGGWTDPDGTAAKQIMRVRVTVHEIFLDAKRDDSAIPDWVPGSPADKGEWYVCIGINGRWQVYEKLTKSTILTRSTFVLDLHPSDRIRITASGREADAINGLMGRNTDLSWSDVIDPKQATNAAKKIRAGFLSLGSDLRIGSDIENDTVSEFSVVHEPQERGTWTRSSSEKDYRLRYSIESA